MWWSTAHAQHGGHDAVQVTRAGSGTAASLAYDLDSDVSRVTTHRLVLDLTLGGSAVRPGWTPARRAEDFAVTATTHPVGANGLVDRVVSSASDPALPHGTELVLAQVRDGSYAEPSPKNEAERLALLAWSAGPDGLGVVFPSDPVAPGAVWTVPGAVKPLGDVLRLDLVTTVELVAHTPRRYPRPGQPPAPPPTAHLRWRSAPTGTGQVLWPGGEPTAVTLDPASGGASGDLVLDLETGSWTGRVEWALDAPLVLPDGRRLDLHWHEVRTASPAP